MTGLTEEILTHRAPSDHSMGDARALLRKGAFRGFARSEDGQLVFAECKGSAKEPYKVSLDFSSGTEHPTFRCSCPSRQRPCKHALALGLAFVQKGSHFPVKEPPADLVEKSEKLRERKEKKGTTDRKPRQVNHSALVKKASQQLDALRSLETFLVDLATTGLGGLKAKEIQGMIAQANRLADRDLKGVRSQLLLIASLIHQKNEDDEAEEDHEAPSRHSFALPEEVRYARMAGQFFRLWAMLRKGQHLLEGKAEEGDSRGEDDAMIEALLGRAWKLPELKEAGYWITERSLIELAHTHWEDSTLEMVFAEGYLLDLGHGSIYIEQTSLPLLAARRPGAMLRTSRSGILEIREAALYPGQVVNRRIRWSEKDDRTPYERARTPEDLRKLHAFAGTVDGAVKALREQLSNPLLPQEAVFLLEARKFGQSRWEGQTVPVMEDCVGQKLLFRDPPGAFFPTSRNLAHAAGAYGPGSVAVKLWYDPVALGIFGQALALMVGEQHLRLGL